MFCINVLLKVKDSADVTEIAGLLTEAGRLSRAEPGCLRFEVFHSQSDEQTFLLCERWQSEAAWQAHRQEQAFTQIYQPKVLPKVDRMPHISTLLA